MTAIIEACGKQYRVSAGDVVYVEKLNEEDGASVTFDKVLAVFNDDGSAVIGKPAVAGATVTATGRFWACRFTSTKLRDWVGSPLAIAANNGLAAESIAAPS